MQHGTWRFHPLLTLPMRPLPRPYLPPGATFSSSTLSNLKLSDLLSAPDLPVRACTVPPCQVKSSHGSPQLQEIPSSRKRKKVGTAGPRDKGGKAQCKCARAGKRNTNPVYKARVSSETRGLYFHLHARPAPVLPRPSSTYHTPHMMLVPDQNRRSRNVKIAVRRQKHSATCHSPFSAYSVVDYSVVSRCPSGTWRHVIGSGFLRRSLERSFASLLEETGKGHRFVLCMLLTVMALPFSSVTLTSLPCRRS